MGVVFAVLALLAISIKGISLLDREPQSAKAPEATAVSVAATPAQGTPVLDGQITGQEVAAIAVALALSEPKSAPMSSSISRAGNTAGSWLQSGRIRMLGSSSSVRERRG